MAKVKPYSSRYKVVKTLQNLAIGATGIAWDLTEAASYQKDIHEATRDVDEYIRKLHKRIATLNKVMEYY